ncbi:hypothetical protein CAPTEDRAFT_26156, partial [Capitella teleta]|uniref:Carbohydrate sulfotransferase n=1 Tax=Capitella teleta TaxID=283909 RepID=X2B224_CAPTE
FLVDDKHQLLYCGFAKAASTSWLRHFVRASGKWKKGQMSIRGKGIERYGFKHLHSLPEKEARDRLQTYRKMIVVRHPLDRLVSAWRDKLVMKDSPYRETIGKRIIRKFRGSYNEGDLATFDEFAHFVAIGSSDPHWGTFRNCKPCLVRYDYISRTETVEQDSGDIMAALGLGDHLPAIHMHRSAGLHSMETHLWQFENVSRKIYDKLLDIYQTDMDIFGY